MGYEDINDHETLRHDPRTALCVGKAINSSQESITLAGKSTLNRIEHCPESVTSFEDSRYHRIEHDGSAIEKLLVEIFLESYRKPPKQIILDLDVTDDLVHGNQESTFFNPYYPWILLCSTLCFLWKTFTSIKTSCIRMLTRRQED